MAVRGDLRRRLGRGGGAHSRHMNERVAVRGDLRRRLGLIPLLSKGVRSWGWQSEVISVGDLDFVGACGGTVVFVGGSQR